MYKLYFVNDSYTWEKLDTFTINEHTKQLRLGRRLLLIENIGFFERFKHLKTLTNIHILLSPMFTNSYLKPRSIVLIQTPTLKYL